MTYWGSASARTMVILLGTNRAPAAPLPNQLPANKPHCATATPVGQQVAPPAVKFLHPALSIPAGDRCRSCTKRGRRQTQQGLGRHDDAIASCQPHLLCHPPPASPPSGSTLPFSLPRRTEQHVSCFLFMASPGVGEGVAGQDLLRSRVTRCPIWDSPRRLFLHPHPHPLRHCPVCLCPLPSGSALFLASGDTLCVGLGLSLSVHLLQGHECFHELSWRPLHWEGRANPTCKLPHLGSLRTLEPECPPVTGNGRDKSSRETNRASGKLR